MLKVLMATLVMVSAVAFAQSKNDLGELQVGSETQNKAAYLGQTDAEVIAHINSEIEDKCGSHGCTFVSRVDHKNGWSVSFSAGNGAGNATSGTNYYIGSGSTQTSNQNYYGITLTYTNMTCTSDFRIQQDDFLNNIGRALAERENNSVLSMKPLSTDMKFVQLVKLEIYKQLSQAGCLR